jgi:hypothetical protein
MRLLVWNGERRMYECSDCRWKQELCADCNDPAEKLELQFARHRCVEHQQKSAA